MLPGSPIRGAIPPMAPSAPPMASAPPASSVPKVTDITNRDYYLIIDKSGSMSVEDVEGSENRWTAVAESTEAIAREIIKYDPDGIDVFVFSNRCKRYENVNSDDVVRNIFRENSPFGGTKLAPVLRQAFSDYFGARQSGNAKANGAIVLVITDGAPDDKPAVVQELIQAANACQHEKELGVSFFQIGYDRGATNFLKHLDDDLQKVGAKYDIVDTKTMDDIEDMGLKAALIAAVNE